MYHLCNSCIEYLKNKHCNLWNKKHMIKLKNYNKFELDKNYKYHLRLKRNLFCILNKWLMKHMFGN